jgi:hypothetical protein
MSVYIMLSTIFVLLVGLTVALIVFTPLKYYIPGYNDLKVGREYREMKYDVDNMARQMEKIEQFNEGLKKGPLQGLKSNNLDTNLLQVPKTEISTD